MHGYLNGEEKPDVCICCGESILPGDLVYDTKEGLLHDECFYDYLRTYIKVLGWKRMIAGGGDI